MIKKFSLLVLVVGVLTLSGCAEGQNMVKNVDQWMQNNMW